MNANETMREENRQAPQELTREQMLADAEELLEEFALDYERMAQ